MGNPKFNLIVQKSINGWFMFQKDKYRLHLSGDTRRDGLWLEQYARKLGKETFMKDFTDILEAIEKDNESLEPKNKISIFSLYVKQ